MPLFSSSCSALENNYIKERRKKKTYGFCLFFGGVFASASALLRSLVVFLQKKVNYIN
jgi:hypothetical protein